MTRVSLDFDHVHLSAPDQIEACGWYMRHLGARPGASPERILIGDQLWLIFYKAEAAKPSRDGVIDSIGFAVPDAAGTARALEADGATIVSPAGPLRGFARAAVVDDPFGIRLTLVDAPGSNSVQFRHVHLTVPDPDGTLAWYLDMFGGDRSTMDGIATLRHGSTWLLADQGHGAPSQGHAIDHIAWRTPDLDSTAASLKQQSVVFTMEPRLFNPTVRISFVEGPSATRIEVLERLA